MYDLRDALVPTNLRIFYENTKFVKTELKRKDLVYPEMSYNIVGALFEVYKELGSGYREKYYQRAVAIELKKRGLHFKEQVAIPLSYKEIQLGKCFLDFLVENKIVLEIKKDEKFSKKHIDQVCSYLKASNLKLGLLANFTKDGVKFKRLLNII